MAIFTDNYCVFDFETGGFLNTSGGRPVEQAILKYVDGVAELTTVLVNAFVDEPSFEIGAGAERVHGLSRDLVERDGVHPQEALRLFNEVVEDSLPVWAHNGCGFDFLIHEAESSRYGLSSMSRDRWRDSAALYKGWKLDRLPKADESLPRYFQEVLDTRRKGLPFNLGFLTEELDLGIRASGDEAWDFSNLGLTTESEASIAELGAHRAGFDCVLTHALIQWMQREWRGNVVDLV